MYRTETATFTPVSRELAVARLLAASRVTAERKRADRKRELAALDAQE